MMDSSIAYLLDSLAANIEDFYSHIEKASETLTPLRSPKPRKVLRPTFSKPISAPAVTTKRQPTSTTSAANGPLSLMQPANTEIKRPTAKVRPQKSSPYNTTSWELSLSPVDPIDDIANLSFSSLKNKPLSEITIPCAIFSHREDCEEVVFVSRLAKIITQKLFPTRCIFVHSASTFKQLLPQYSLGLLSPSLSQQYFPNTSPHVSLLYDQKSLIIPIYSSEEYSNNIGLKKDLWAILSKQPFVNMPK